MTYPTSVVSLFCEDIRQEITGQFSLIGVLADNAVVPTPPPGTDPNSPGMIPRLALYTRINFDVDVELGPISFTVEMPDGQIMPAGGVTPETLEEARGTRSLGNPMGGVISVLRLQNFVVPKLGRVIFRVTIGDQSYIAGFLNVTLDPNDSPTASPLPS
jgi:hypothetical protein